MFDKITHKTETTVTPVTRVVEKTITPDKVTEMYDAVKEEVLNSIVRTYTVETNSLNFVVIEYINQMETLVTKYRTKFTLNGKEYTLDGDLKKEDMIGGSEYHVIKKVQQYYAQLISLELIKETPMVHHKMTRGNTPKSTT